MPEGRHTYTRSHRRYRELAFRESDRISVRLYWDSLENEVFVSVRDDRNGDDFVLNPPKHEALSAFYHPYAVRPIEGPSLIAAPPARGRLEV
jgi:hypothetical protein